MFDQLVKLVLGAGGDPVIAAGPFAGLTYVRGSIGSSLVPKLLGTYEMELNDWIGSLPHFDLGLDVGAAEGYYAVGLLKSGICTRMIAWEGDPVGRGLLEELAAKNHVEENLETRGYCDANDFETVISEQRPEAAILGVIDCEGYEGVLLSNVCKKALGRCHLLIETHEYLKPGVHGLARIRLEDSHDIIEVLPKKRGYPDLRPGLRGIHGIFSMPFLRRLAMSERRCPDIRWLLCTPKTASRTWG